MHAEKPWNLEPDFKKWIDRETGLVCAIIRHDECGHLCGYVKVPHSNLRKRMIGRTRIPAGIDMRGKLCRLSSASLREITGLSVHGGITFSGRFRRIHHASMHRGYWIGFDCAHCYDRRPKMDEFMQRRGLPPSGGIYRDFAYVTRECADLAKQLKAIL